MRGAPGAWRWTALAVLALTAACRSRCSGAAALDAAAPEASAQEASAPTADDAPMDAATGAAKDSGPAEPVMVGSDAKLSFDGKGRTLRIVDAKIRIFEAETMKLEAEHDTGGEIESVARDVLLVAEGDAATDRTKHSLVDIPSGKRAPLPSSWFVDGKDGEPREASLSERGDRLAVVGGGIGRLTARIYDTNTRKEIATVSTNTGTPAGGLFGGEIMADGRHVKWCHSRAGTCSVTNLDGGAEPSVARFSVSSSKWTIDIPLDWEKQQVQPLRVRDESGALVGKLAVPITGGDQDGPPLYGIALCAGVDRAVVVRSPHLYVVHLPDGKRLATEDLDASADAIPIVACAPGATRVALALLDGKDAAPLMVRPLPVGSLR